MIFVIAFDRGRGTIVAYKTFEESARLEAESMYRMRLADAMFQDRDAVEVNMFEADSEAAFRKTHSRYFQTIKQPIESLRRPA
jgi:hypothetical protein